MNPHKCNPVGAVVACFLLFCYNFACFAEQNEMRVLETVSGKVKNSSDPDLSLKQIISDWCSEAGLNFVIKADKVPLAPGRPLEIAAVDAVNLRTLLEKAKKSKFLDYTVDATRVEGRRVLVLQIRALVSLEGVVVKQISVRH